MKMTKTGSVSRSIRVGGKMMLVAGASMLVAMACGDGGDSGGDGDGDGDGNGAGGVVNGTGGTGTGGVIGGTGGIVSGTGGTVVTPTTPGEAVGTALTPGDFAVDATGYGTDATSGFQGPIYTYTDMNGSVIYPPDFGTISEAEIAEGKFCVNGTGAQVLDMMYSTYWGAGVGWNLNQAADSTVPEPTSVAAYGGVTFTLHQAVTSETRIVVGVVDSAGTKTDYCKSLTPGENTVLWSELNSTCWDNMGDAPDLAMNGVENISFQVPTNTSGPAPFDFCIGGLSFIAGDGMGGAPAL